MEGADRKDADTHTPAASTEVSGLARELRRRAPLDAAKYLEAQDKSLATAVFTALPPGFAAQVLKRLPTDIQEAIQSPGHSDADEQWTLPLDYPEDTVGWLMGPPKGLLAPDLTVAEATQRIREMSKRAPITYGYVVDDEDNLLGVVVMRDLILADRDASIQSIMLTHPFAFSPNDGVNEAMLETVYRQYPVYPVCENGKLIGLVPGYLLFEEYNFSLSAQAGRMVGVSKEERYATPLKRCFLIRTPWLHFNLLTAFLAAAVVGLFEDTIAQIVVLAVFLPVLDSQCGNTGNQALAVTLRGLTLGEHGVEAMGKLLRKEALLGFCNGVSVGLLAAAAMVGYSLFTGIEDAWMLGLVMWLALVSSCTLSGMSGVLVPLTLKRLGIDPATASSIFFSTCSDVASLGLFLGIATLMVL